MLKCKTIIDGYQMINKFISLVGEMTGKSEEQFFVWNSIKSRKTPRNKFICLNKSILKYKNKTIIFFNSKWKI